MKFGIALLMAGALWAGEPGVTEVSLERTGCLGTCPQYRVTIAASGAVEFEGVKFVAKTGKSHSTVPKEKVRELFQQIDRIRFSSLKDQYSGGATDQETVYVTVKRGGVSKRIQDYGTAGPPALKELERSIDQVAGPF